MVVLQLQSVLTVVLENEPQHIAREAQPFVVVPRGQVQHVPDLLLVVLEERAANGEEGEDDAQLQSRVDQLEVRDDGIEVLRCEKRRELETVGQRR